MTVFNILNKIDFKITKINILLYTHNLFLLFCGFTLYGRRFRQNIIGSFYTKCFQVLLDFHLHQSRCMAHDL